MLNKVNKEYLSILKGELIPAMGCTEPVSVAYAGAVARKYLGIMPEKVILTISNNIVKNVKSVIVPNTGGRKGLITAVAAGICYGNADKVMEVLTEANDEKLVEMDRFIASAEFEILESKSNHTFDIQVRLEGEGHSSSVRIIGTHTNIVSVKKDDSVILEKYFSDEPARIPDNRRLLNIKDIVEYADTVNIEDVKETLDRQIECNMAIAQEGLSGKYGASIGKILIKSFGNSAQVRAKAYAAAASDARMNGCELPVVINSGSGNQGITASVPVIVYAKEYGVTREVLYRALVVSNLVTIHLKDGIGTLSAYCGATSAGAGAGAGVSYIMGGRYDEIAHTVVNTLAINSGMICDGAKSSCAAKIASAVEAAILGLQMYVHGSQFYGGDGIVVKGVENTIDAVSKVARLGMKETDKEIIRLMLHT